VNRDELEAAIWRQVTRQDAYDPAEAVDAILAAADAYALDTYGITAERRTELAADGWFGNAVPVHLLDGNLLACRPLGAWVMRKTATTDDPARVTCRRCRNSPAWLALTSPGSPVIRKASA